MSIKILGTGSYLPPKVMTNADFEKFLDTSDEWITTRTGIKRRHIVEDEQNVDMCVIAANKALKAAGVNKGDITGIICASVTNEMCVPTIASQVGRAMELDGCFAFDINAACTGFVYALKVAEGMCALADETLLVLGTETLSRLMNYEDRSTCVIFADGAGAAIVKRGDNLKYLKLHATADVGHSLEIPGLNFSLKEKTPKFSYVTMDGKEIYKFATKEAERIILEAMDELNLTKDDIDHFLIHQANVRIIAAISKRLEAPMEKFYVNIQEVGNVSSASIPIALDEMFKQGLLKTGDKLLLAGFGGGLTSGCGVYVV